MIVCLSRAEMNVISVQRDSEDLEHNKGGGCFTVEEYHGHMAASERHENLV